MPKNAHRKCAGIKLIGHIVFSPLQQGASAAHSRALAGSGWQAYLPLDKLLGPRNHGVGFIEVQRPKGKGSQNSPTIEGPWSRNEKQGKAGNVTVS